MDNFAANLKEVNDLIDNDPVFLGQLDKLIENSIDYWKESKYENSRKATEEEDNGEY